MRLLSESARQKQHESQKRIHKATLEQIIVYVKKGERDKYKALATSLNMSLNALIITLLNQRLERYTNDKCGNNITANET